MKLLVALVLGLQTSQGDTLRIRFIGNAAFELSDGITTLVTDFPYQSGAYGYMRYDMTAARPPAEAVSVITHHHADHFDAALALRHGWRVVGPPDVTGQLEPNQVAGGSGETRIGAFTITPIRTPHVPEHFSYLITWREKRLYFTGDTDDPTVLLDQRRLDLAFVTPWLLCAVSNGGHEVPAVRVVLHHQQPSEPAPDCGRPIVLRQSETFVVSPGI